MKSLTGSFAVLLLLFPLGCGTEAAPETETAEAVGELEELEPLPPPAPVEPPPPPLAECPEDTWAVGADGTNTAAADGPAAANLVREATRGSSWTRVSICRTVDGEEMHMICGPSQAGNGAECSLGMPGRRCSTTMPGPVLPVAAGDFVDNSEVPSNSEWNCSDT